MFRFSSIRVLHTPLSSLHLPVGGVENHTGRGALHNSNPCVRTECDLSFNEVCLELTIAAETAT